MKTRTHGALLAGALLLAGATAIRAQDAQPDHRWQAWLGCWEPTDAPPESATQLVCVIPATGTSAVEILTVAAGRIVAREHVAASAGARRVASSRNGCAGWESAEWSPQGQRVYLRAEYACPDGLRRSSSGLMAMSATGEWLDVQGVALPGGQTGVRVRRYREAGALSQSTLPEEIAAAPGGGGVGVRAVAAARAAAGASLTTADVVEATGHLDAAVVESWLAARGQGFAIDAKGLVTLADAAVPTRVIDLVVALSYPKVFAVNPASRQADFLRHPSDSTGYAYTYTNPYGYSPLGLDYYPYSYAGFYDGYGPYGWNPYAPYGYGGYAGGTPVIIVVRSDATPRPHGRLVNGHGYSEGTGAGTTSQPAPAPQPGTWGSSTSASSGRTSAAGTSSTSSSGSSSGTRTAKPRP